MTPSQRSNIWDDLYKVTMGQGVFRYYDRVDAHYVFIDRGGTEFPLGFDKELRRRINRLPDVATTPDERMFLSGIGSPRPFLRPAYVDWLVNYRYNPDEVEIRQDGGKVDIDIRGPWYRTIRWEVKLMAMMVELYNELMGREPKDGWLGAAAEKGRRLREAGAHFSDFGTRRAFSGPVHDEVLRVLADSAGPRPAGTSNLHLAMKHRIRAMGTKSHEWFMAHACMFGVREATRLALQAWTDEFGSNLGIALTDTFTTDVFLRNFGPYFAKLYDGVRHDSGCPLRFADRIIAHYGGIGIDPRTKTIIFSDGLDIDAAIRILEHCGDRIKVAFGIGTHLTNDVGHPPLNIVIKLRNLTVRNHDGSRTIPAVKLSDDTGKASGDGEAIRHAMYELGLGETK